VVINVTRLFSIQEMINIGKAQKQWFLFIAAGPIVSVV
jgi:hypothetical protein